MLSNCFFEKSSLSLSRLSNGEELYYRGVRAIAAPIFMDRKVACAICVTGSVHSMTPEKIANIIIPNLLQTTQKISKLLTY